MEAKTKLYSVETEEFKKEENTNIKYSTDRRDKIGDELKQKGFAMTAQGKVKQKPENMSDEERRKSLLDAIRNYKTETKN